MSSTFVTEMSTQISAPRLFKAAILDYDNLGPKIAADKIISVVTVEGDGGIGSVRQMNFTPEVPYSYEQRKLEFMDIENCEIKSSVVGGGLLGILYESASYHVKIMPSDTGSLVKMVVTYTLVPGGNRVKFENMVKGVLAHIIKGCEEFLLANEDLYN